MIPVSKVQSVEKRLLSYLEQMLNLFLLEISVCNVVEREYKWRTEKVGINICTEGCIFIGVNIYSCSSSVRSSADSS